MTVEKLKSSEVEKLKGSLSTVQPFNLSTGGGRFRTPSVAEVAEYAAGIGYAIDAGHFVDYWEARGWEVRPRIKMKDWRAAVRNWRRQEKTWAVEKGAPGKPDAAEKDAHREEVAQGVAKQLLEEMLFWVRLSRQDDEEGRERHAEAVAKIAETAARARRLGGKRALEVLRARVRSQLKGSEVEKLKSGCRQLKSGKVEKLKSSDAQPFNLSTVQPFNPGTRISRSEGGLGVGTGKYRPEGRGANCNGFATGLRGRLAPSEK